MGDSVEFRIVTKSETSGGGSPSAPAPSGGGGSSAPAVNNPPAHAPAPLPQPAAPPPGATNPGAHQPAPLPQAPPIQPIVAPPIQPRGAPGTPILMPNAMQRFQTGAGAVGQGGGLAGMSMPAMAGGAASMLGAAAAPIMAIAAAAFVFKGAVDVFRSATQSAFDQAAPFSGRIASAQARNEALQVMADLRTSRRLGDVLGRKEEAEGRFSRAAQEIRDAVLAPILEAFIPYLETIAKWAEAIAKNADTIEKVGEIAIAAQFPGSWVSQQIIAGIRGAEAEKKVEELDPFLLFDQQPWPSETNPVGGRGTRVDGNFEETKIDPAFVAGGMLN